MRFQRTYELACPPSRLWPYLEEPEKQKRWMKGLLSSELVSGDGGPGSRLAMRIREGGRVSDYEGEVVAREVERRLAIRMWGGCLREGQSISADYRLTPIDGGTRLAYEARGELVGWQRLLAPLFTLFCSMQLNGFIRALRREVEAPEAAAG